MNAALQQLAKKFHSLQNKYHPKRAIYPENLKKEAIQIVQEGVKATELNRVCHLPSSLIRVWSKKYGTPTPTNSPAPFKRVEIVSEKASHKNESCVTIKTAKGLTLQFHDLKRLIQFIQYYENYS
jgi:hypothetical protein